MTVSPRPHIVSENDMPSSFEFITVETSRGKRLEYLVSLPDGFEVGKDYPTLFALPPGEQTRELALVYELWIPYFQKEGWVICSPIAPDGRLFFRGSERFLPQMMDHVESKVNILAGKFFLFGVSNGGVSAFREATLNRDRFHSVTVLPGWPKPADEKRLTKRLHLPVNFVVGEFDDRWRTKSELFYNKLQEMGGDVSLELIPDVGHMAFHVVSAEELLP